MKNKTRFTSIAIVAILLLGSVNSFAQRDEQRNNQRRGARGMGFHQRGDISNMLDLSDDQKTQLKEHRSTIQKNMKYEANLLKEKEAHLKTLLSAPERDKKAINSTIDEIFSAKGEMLKKKIAHQEEMKSFFTEEQLGKMEVLHNKRGRSQKGMRERGKSQRVGQKHMRGSGVHLGMNEQRGRGFGGKGYGATGSGK